MARGGKKLDTSNWMRPGGSLPAKGPDLTPEEQAHYKAILKAMEPLSVGGRSDLAMVVLCARLAARADKLRAALDALEELTVQNKASATVMHPLFAEVGRTESKLKDLYAALYLSPRARGSTKLSESQKSQAQYEYDPVMERLLDSGSYSNRWTPE